MVCRVSTSRERSRNSAKRETSRHRTMMKLRAMMRSGFLTKTEQARKRGSLRKRKPRSTPPWSDVRANEGFVREVRWLKDVRAHNPARLAKDFPYDLQEVDAHACHDLPLGAGWRGIFAGTPLARILRMSYDLAVHLEPAGLAFEFALQSRTRISFTGK